MLGEALRKSGALDQAISCYNEVLKLNPKDVETYLRLAECNMQLDLLDAAKEAVKKRNNFV